MKQTNYSYTDTRAASYNEGLRSYMTYVYNYMAAALLLTGLVAMVTASSSLVNMMFTPNGITGLGMIITLAPLGIVLTMSFGLNKIKLSTMQLLFWSYYLHFKVSVEQMWKQRYRLFHITIQE